LIAKDTAWGFAILPKNYNEEMTTGSAGQIRKAKFFNKQQTLTSQAQWSLHIIVQSSPPGLIVLWDLGLKLTRLSIVDMSVQQQQFNSLSYV